MSDYASTRCPKTAMVVDAVSVLALATFYGFSVWLLLTHTMMPFLIVMFYTSGVLLWACLIAKRLVDGKPSVSQFIC